MEPIQWLEVHAPGFMQLEDVERQAILHFALLWSFFEARALNTRGSSERIRKLTEDWYANGLLQVASFSEPLAYFRERYFNNGQPTEHLDGLYLRKNDSPALVHRVLRGEDATTAEIVAALLIVVFRLRNNLFHGTKWAYGIGGQLSNFRHANSVLMNALAIGGPL